MLILYLLLLAGITVLSLWLANTGIRHAEGFAALREWMYETRYGWLIWRLCVYCALGWWGVENLACTGLQTGIQGTFSSYGHSQCFVCSAV
ncbi:Uncharacterised protein [Escherichia coli]|uniref:Uncharacterized protein n=1 Tax=Escherichia coli TaxID=562 RepID=A0A376KLL8_ECOLX|nr:Uncharacterised protein [Escherichia coli]